MISFLSFQFIGGLAAAVFILVALLTMFVLRRVVPTNMVHIVQSSKATTAFGKGKDAGNTYYAIPSWVPNTSNRRVGLRPHVLIQTGRQHANPHPSSAHRKALPV